MWLWVSLGLKDSSRFDWLVKVFREVFSEFVGML